MSQTTSCPGFNYTIRAGDTFFRLAQRFGTTVAAIQAANPGVDPNNLQIGQVICIPTGPAPGPGPGRCPNGFLYTVQSGDTFFRLAQRFGTTVAAIQAANPGVDPNNLQIGQVICIPTGPAPGPVPCPNGFLYTIQSGDTFFRLAQRFGTTVQAIQAANPGVDPNNLQIGQVICIPVRPAPGPVPPVCPGFFYTIQPGDTIFQLAARFGTTTAAIIAANPGIDPNNLIPGQRICIPVQQPPVCQGFFYTIQPGDTIFQLAARFGTTPAAIIAANPGIDPNNLIPGQRICIPVQQPPVCQGFFYTIQPGDTLFELAARFGTTVAAIIAANPGIDPNNLIPGQRICIPVQQPPVCQGFFYTIQPGDTLFELAARFGTTVAAIIAANPGIDPNNLIPGQRICIPVQPPPTGRRCLVMAPTDLAPNADGVLFLDYTDNVVLGTASNVPDPMEFNQEVYKLWLREVNTNNWVVTTMFRSPQDTWVGRIVPAQTLTVFNAAVISAEQAANTERPVGSRVLTAVIPSTVT